MNSILMGLNRFTDCRTLIAWKDRPVLRIEDKLSSLLLDTTGLDEKIRGIRIEGKVVTQGNEGNDVRVVASHEGTTVLVGNEAILFVTQIDVSTFHVKLDLRPLGLNIFDDFAGLHVGSNVVARNSFSNCHTGIQLK